MLLLRSGLIAARTAPEAGPRARPPVVPARRGLARRAVLVLLAGILLVLLGVAPAAADGGPAGVVASPARLHAGDTVTVSGGATWTEAQITVALVGRGGASRPLGAGTTNPDGSLEFSAVLPPDLPDGPYRIVVRNALGEELSAPIVVESAVPVIPIGVGLAVLAVVAFVVASGRRRAAARLHAGADAPEAPVA